MEPNIITTNIQSKYVWYVKYNTENKYYISGSTSKD